MIFLPEGFGTVNRSHKSIVKHHYSRADFRQGEIRLTYQTTTRCCPFKGLVLSVVEKAGIALVGKILSGVV